MISQSPCIFTLSFPDQQQASEDKRVLVLPFCYDLPVAPNPHDAAANSNTAVTFSLEQLEDAAFDSLKKAKPTLLELLGHSAEYCLNQPSNEPLFPVLKQIALLKPGVDMSQLNVSLDFFGFEAEQLAKDPTMGPGWARASLRGFKTDETITDKHIAAALHVCVNRIKNMGFPILSAKVPEPLLDFCEERTDAFPAAAVPAIMKHNISLLSQGISLSNYVVPSLDQAIADVVRRPLNVLWIQYTRESPAYISSKNFASAGQPTDMTEHGLVFWPAVDASDKTAQIKQKLQLMKAIMDAKKHNNLSDQAYSILQQIGYPFGVGAPADNSSSPAVAPMSQSTIPADHSAFNVIESLNVSAIKIEGIESTESFQEAMKVLTQAVALQMGPSCALGGRTAGDLAENLRSQQLHPLQWQNLSQAMTPMIQKSEKLSATKNEALLKGMSNVVTVPNTLNDFKPPKAF